jgi:hypothetical protein
MTVSSIVVKLPPNIVFRSVNDEALFISLSSQQYYFLDPIGSRICELLIEHGRVEPVIAQLLAEFDVDEATLRRDIDTLLGGLSANGLLTVERQANSEPDTSSTRQRPA